MPTISDSQLSSVLNQLITARIYTPAGDRGLIDAAIKTLQSLTGAAAPSPAPAPAPTPAPRMTLAKAASIRGTNWSCFEDGRKHVAPVADYLRRVRFIRLPVTHSYVKSEIEAIFVLADTIPGAVVAAERHGYGTEGDGRSSNGVSTGPLSTPAQTAAWNVQFYRDFGHHPSYVAMLDNEPKQTGPQWELNSQAALTALRAAGYTGVVFVSGAQASNVGSWPKNHPKPWISDPLNNVVYVGHHYPEGQQEGGTQTVAQLDAYAVSRGFKTYADYIRSWFSWGLLGNTAWHGQTVLIGETHFVHAEHLELYLQLCTAAGIGVCLWADGNWSPGYGFKVTESDLSLLDKFRA